MDPAGEATLIGKAGKPVARLVPLQPARKRRVLGLLAHGKTTLVAGFDAPLPDDHGPCRPLTTDPMLARHTNLVWLQPR